MSDPAPEILISQEYTPQDYHDAIYKIGPLAFRWDDKPHRLVIQAKEHMLELEAQLAEVQRRERILIEHMTEVKAIVDGCHTNTLEGVVNHCLEELKGDSK